jgi:AcrR family transcriptional regulator
MSEQQLTPKRTRRSGTQARGRARRDLLLNAAAELLAEKELEEITFNEVAQHAGVPKGSAYHFYANISDVYSALTKRIGEELLECLAQPLEGHSLKRWEDAIEVFCDRAVTFYAERPDARQLLIGGKTPPQYKRTDRENDRRIGELMLNYLDLFFDVPKMPNREDILFFTVEIIDLMYCLSMIHHNHITPSMAAEAKRAGIAYLRSYLPAELALRDC